jgi:uncharacterized protein (DUF4415 family)
MQKKKRSTGTAWADSDDAPELTDAMLDRADFYDGDRLIKRGRGRPRLERPKEQVTLRLDADVIAALRKSGPGWTGRVNDILSQSVKTGRFRIKSHQKTVRTGQLRMPTLKR